MRASEIRQIFIDSTASFDISSSVRGAFGVEDDLIKSARRYYLLLPREGLVSNWASISKPRRRRIIKDHLESVCDKVDISNVREVDRWLTTRSGSRALLLQHGRKLQEKYGRMCFICGKKIEDDLTVDHIFPFTRGGGMNIENLILAHRNCNSGKNDALPGELMRWAPSDLSASPDQIEIRTRYLVFLRDNFTCQVEGCSDGLFSRDEIDVQISNPTGIACYDNLITKCVKCMN